LQDGAILKGEKVVMENEDLDLNDSTLAWNDLVFRNEAQDRFRVCHATQRAILRLYVVGTQIQGLRPGQVRISLCAHPFSSFYSTKSNRRVGFRFLAVFGGIRIGGSGAFRR
jgi:hypothetical protein